MESSTSIPGLVWSRVTPSAIGYALLLFVSIIIIFDPLAGLLTELGCLALSGNGFSALAGFVTERRFMLLLKSVGLAAAVAAAGIGAEVLVATALWCRSRTVALGVILLFLALVPIPPYIRALTWSSALALFNQWLALIGAAPLPVTGLAVSFWVKFMALLPIAIFLSYIGLASVDWNLIEAARMVRPSS